jgi:hypothetical protein
LLSVTCRVVLALGIVTVNQSTSVAEEIAAEMVVPKAIVFAELEVLLGS